MVHYRSIQFPTLWSNKGFTIGMWVRFLDRINRGTLFNFGNPYREQDPKGFMLQTFTLSKEDFEEMDENIPVDAFVKNDYERFVRLVVREPDGLLRDSHIGNQDNNRISTNDLTDLDTHINPFQYTRIPIDFREWYFICASYNPNVVELSYGEHLSNNPAGLRTNDQYWLNHVNEVKDYWCENLKIHPDLEIHYCLNHYKNHYWY